METSPGFSARRENHGWVVAVALLNRLELAQRHRDSPLRAPHRSSHASPENDAGQLAADLPEYRAPLPRQELRVFRVVGARAANELSWASMHIVGLSTQECARFRVI